jgi:hypothetical protein
LHSFIVLCETNILNLINQYLDNFLHKNKTRRAVPNRHLNTALVLLEMEIVAWWLCRRRVLGLMMMANDSTGACVLCVDPLDSGERQGLSVAVLQESA